VADVLERAANSDDVAVLVALASAPRYVTPVGEASIRRALLAIVEYVETQSDLDRLTPLALAVGLGDIVDHHSSPAVSG
jgi:hypothetical protein